MQFNLSSRPGLPTSSLQLQHTSVLPDQNVFSQRYAFSLGSIT